MPKEKEPPIVLNLSVVLETWRADTRVKSNLDDLQNRYSLSEQQMLHFIHALSVYRRTSRSLLPSFDRNPLIKMFGTKEKMANELSAFAANFPQLLLLLVSLKKNSTVIEFGSTSQTAADKTDQ